MAPFKGRALKFEFLEADSKAAPRLVSARPAQQWGFKADPSSESFRPKFHFTAPVGWHNDPNGLIYIDGVWHMFYQYNPFSLRWAAPMQWGYAKSKDFIDWQHCGIALWAKGNSQMFSGTAYADFCNRSGLFSSSKGGVIFALTDTALGESLYISEDMDSFKEVDFNPIIPAKNEHATAARDPRIFFNEDSGLWTVVRYERSGGVDGVAFYVSENLKDWTRTDFVKALYECPDIAKLKVENTGEYKWLLIDASFNYVVGDFDGRKFIEEKGRKADGSESLKEIFSADKFVSRRVAKGVYATQFFENVYDGRCIAISWLRINPSEVAKNGMCFSQCMSVPYEVSLALKDGLYVMKARPSAEILNAFGDEKSAIGKVEGFSPDLKSVSFTPADWRGKLLRINLKTSPNADIEISLSPFGKFIYSADSKGNLDALLFVDTLSAEAFFGDGYFYSAKTAISGDSQTLSVCSSAPLKLRKLTYSELKESR